MSVSEPFFERLSGEPKLRSAAYNQVANCFTEAMTVSQNNQTIDLCVKCMLDLYEAHHVRPNDLLNWKSAGPLSLWRSYVSSNVALRPAFLKLVEFLLSKSSASLRNQLGLHLFLELNAAALTLAQELAKLPVDDRYELDSLMQLIADNPSPYRLTISGAVAIRLSAANLIVLKHFASVFVNFGSGSSNVKASEADDDEEDSMPALSGRHLLILVHYTTVLAVNSLVPGAPQLEGLKYGPVEFLILSLDALASLVHHLKETEDFPTDALSRLLSILYRFNDRRVLRDAFGLNSQCLDRICTKSEWLVELFKRLDEVDDLDQLSEGLGILRDTVSLHSRSIGCRHLAHVTILCKSILLDCPAMTDIASTILKSIPQMATLDFEWTYVDTELTQLRCAIDRSPFNSNFRQQHFLVLLRWLTGTEVDCTDVHDELALLSRIFQSSLSGRRISAESISHFKRRSVRVKILPYWALTELAKYFILSRFRGILQSASDTLLLLRHHLEELILLSGSTVSASRDYVVWKIALFVEFLFLLETRFKLCVHGHVTPSKPAVPGGDTLSAFYHENSDTLTSWFLIMNQLSFKASLVIQETSDTDRFRGLLFPSDPILSVLLSNSLDAKSDGFESSTSAIKFAWILAQFHQGPIISAIRSMKTKLNLDQEFQFIEQFEAENYEAALALDGAKIMKQFKPLTKYNSLFLSDANAKSNDTETVLNKLQLWNAINRSERKSDLSIQCLNESLMEMLTFGPNLQHQTLVVDLKRPDLSLVLDNRLHLPIRYVEWPGALQDHLQFTQGLQQVEPEFWYHVSQLAYDRKCFKLSGLFLDKFSQSNGHALDHFAALLELDPSLEMKQQLIQKLSLATGSDMTTKKIAKLWRRLSLHLPMSHIDGQTPYSKSRLDSLMESLKWEQHETAYREIGKCFEWKAMASLQLILNFDDITVVNQADCLMTELQATLSEFREDEQTDLLDTIQAVFRCEFPSLVGELGLLESKVDQDVQSVYQGIPSDVRQEDRFITALKIVLKTFKSGDFLLTSLVDIICRLQKSIATDLESSILEGFFKSLQQSQNAKDSSMICSLLKFLDRVRYISSSQTDTVASYVRSMRDNPTFVDVLSSTVPQLLAQVHTVSQNIFPILLSFVDVLLDRSPSVIIYPLISLKKSSSGTLAASIGNLASKYERLFESVELLSNDLHKMSVLPEEMSHGFLNRLLNDFNRRIEKYSMFCQRYASQRQSDSADDLKSQNEALFAPLIAALHEHVAQMEIRSENSLHGSWYRATYLVRLDNFVKMLKPLSEHDSDAVKSAWLPVQKIYEELSSLTNHGRTLELATIMPSLSRTDILEHAITPCTACSTKVVLIRGIRSHIHVMSTKTRPKQIIFECSDGRDRMFLLKGMEDLHLDERISQLLSILNNCFLDYKMPNGPLLNARHYAVIPFGRQAGLIEWVNGTVSIFALYQSWQKRKASGLNSDTVASARIKPTEEWMKLMSEALLELNIPNTRPRQKWPMEAFVDTYMKAVNFSPDFLIYNEVLAVSSSAVEHTLRLHKFAQSTAVMSMIGYLIGLGDRHLDNVLVDVEASDIVHIDYNICFDKGKRLRIPERVACRLTKNIVSGFGCTGVHGHFKRSAHDTLNVLRQQKELITLLLRAFISDPLLDWEGAMEEARVLFQAELKIHTDIISRQKTDLRNCWAPAVALIDEIISSDMFPEIINHVHAAGLASVRFQTTDQELIDIRATYESAMVEIRRLSEDLRVQRVSLLELCQSWKKSALSIFESLMQTSNVMSSLKRGDLSADSTALLDGLYQAISVLGDLGIAFISRDVRYHIPDLLESESRVSSESIWTGIQGSVLSQDAFLNLKTSVERKLGSTAAAARNILSGPIDEVSQWIARIGHSCSNEIELDIALAELLTQIYVEFVVHIRKMNNDILPHRIGKEQLSRFRATLLCECQQWCPDIDVFLLEAGIITSSFFRLLLNLDGSVWQLEEGDSDSAWSPQLHRSAFNLALNCQRFVDVALSLQQDMIAYFCCDVLLLPENRRRELNKLMLNTDKFDWGSRLHHSSFSDIFEPFQRLLDALVKAEEVTKSAFPQSTQNDGFASNLEKIMDDFVTLMSSVVVRLIESASLVYQDASLIRQCQFNRSLSRSFIYCIIQEASWLFEIASEIQAWIRSAVTEIVLKPLSKSIAKSLKAQLTQLSDLSVVHGLPEESSISQKSGLVIMDSFNRTLDRLVTAGYMTDQSLDFVQKTNLEWITQCYRSFVQQTAFMSATELKNRQDSLMQAELALRMTTTDADAIAKTITSGFIDRLLQDPIVKNRKELEFAISAAKKHLSDFRMFRASLNSTRTHCQVTVNEIEKSAAFLETRNEDIRTMRNQIERLRKLKREMAENNRRSIPHHLSDKFKRACSDLVLKLKSGLKASEQLCSSLETVIGLCERLEIVTLHLSEKTTLSHVWRYIKDRAASIRHLSTRWDGLLQESNLSEFSTYLTQMNDFLLADKEQLMVWPQLFDCTITEVEELIKKRKSSNISYKKSSSAEQNGLITEERDRIMDQPNAQYDIVPASLESERASLSQISKEFNVIPKLSRTGSTMKQRGVAERILKIVRSRLDGQERQGEKVASLTVEQQVAWVIKESMDVENLALMYEGWTAWI